MSIVYVLIGISLLLASGFLCAFIWAQKSGQNDDLYTPSVRILFENKTQANKEDSFKPKNS